MDCDDFHFGEHSSKHKTEVTDNKESMAMMVCFLRHWLRALLREASIFSAMEAKSMSKNLLSDAASELNGNYEHHVPCCNGGQFSLLELL